MKAFENSGSTRKSIGGNGSITNKENHDPMTPTHSAVPIEQTVRITIIKHTHIACLSLIQVNFCSIGMLKAQDHQVNAPQVQVNGHSIDDFSNRNTALNETVNTEAFASPKSELITSSPNHNEQSGHIVERDANIISVSPNNSITFLSHQEIKWTFFFSLFGKH